MIKISIINESSVLKNNELELVLPYLQKQISDDFYPAWGEDARLDIVSPDSPYNGNWGLVILDNSDQADALGYHDFTSEGLPLGKVFAESDIKCGNSWMVTMSHEILEMLVDPEINLCAYNEGKLYAYEVCDPVEDDALAYKVGEVLLSDFVYPSWFSPNGKPPYDKCGHVSKPFQLAPGGYISVMDVYSFGWKQINSNPVMARAKMGSRRERRKVPQNELRRSK